MVRAVAGIIPETGSFTPGFVNIGTGTYATQQGSYVLIGNVMTAVINIDIATLGTASGSVRINGLPYANGPILAVGSDFGNNFSVGVNNMRAMMTSSSSDVVLRYNTGQASFSALQHSDLGTGNISVTITYLIS